MQIALCNEVLRDLPLPQQFDLAARLGYDGLELAPFTLGDEPHRLSSAERRSIRRLAGDAGLAIVGLHWLLVVPPGLSITADDPDTRRRTLEVLRGLVELCADLGGRVLVHGSPGQRRIGPQEDAAEARRRAVEAITLAAEAAGRAGLTYCLEALPRASTEFVNTLAEAADIVTGAGNPALRCMIDTCAAAACEPEPVRAVIERWMPTGLIAHVQLNDRSGSAPGQGEDDFAPLLEALAQARYAGAMSVEPFVYAPNGPTCAARAIGYLRGVMAGLRL